MMLSFCEGDSRANTLFFSASVPSCSSVSPIELVAGDDLADVQAHVLADLCGSPGRCRR